MLSRFLSGFELRSIWKRIAAQPPSLFARRKYAPVQLVSFSLMAPHRVGENDDGRGNFDGCVCAKELRMNNHEARARARARSVRWAGGTKRDWKREQNPNIFTYFSSRRRYSIDSLGSGFIHIGHTREGTWEIGKNKYPQSARDKYFIYFFSRFIFPFFTRASGEAAKTVTYPENRGL